MTFALRLMYGGLVGTLQGWEPSEDDEDGRKGRCPISTAFLGLRHALTGLLELQALSEVELGPRGR